MNPNAQYTFVVTPEEVLADRLVASPLTRAMCAPIGDGAAAAILMSEEAVLKYGLSSRAVRVRASVLGSGRTRGADEPDIGERLAKIAYERAAWVPATSTASRSTTRPRSASCTRRRPSASFRKAREGCAPSGARRASTESSPSTRRAGCSPAGASGLAQIHELVTQLRGDAGPRQVKRARIALAENGGGAIGDEEAAMCIHVLEGPS